jgi:hypothetical protein
MWIGSPSHRCSAITYSDERSLNWLGPGMACSHALASGCATPMSLSYIITRVAPHSLSLSLSLDIQY